MNQESINKVCDQIIKDHKRVGATPKEAIKHAIVSVNHLISAVPSSPVKPMSVTPLQDVALFWFGVQTELNRRVKG